MKHCLEFLCPDERSRSVFGFILPFQRSFSLWGIGGEQKPEPELGKKVGAGYAREVRPEFLFCAWHAVRILLVQGPCCHLAELMVSSPLLFADAVVRTSVKWQCFCTVLAKPGPQDEKSFLRHVWDADFCFLIRTAPRPSIPNSTAPYHPTSFFVSDPHILQVRLHVSIMLWKTRKDKTADRGSWAQRSGPGGAHWGVCWFHF